MSSFVARPMCARTRPRNRLIVTLSDRVQIARYDDHDTALLRAIAAAQEREAERLGVHPQDVCVEVVDPMGRPVDDAYDFSGWLDPPSAPPTAAPSSPQVWPPASTPSDPFDPIHLTHLLAWLDRYVPEVDHGRHVRAIFRALSEHPGLIETHSWPEIARLGDVF